MGFLKSLARGYPSLVLLAAFALRLFHLGADSLWYDETVSLYLARQDLVSLTRHTAGDIHPPFYYYLLHFWGQWAGWSEFSAAFLSLFFGVLLIALVFRVARDWFNPRVAGIAALLVASSPYNLWYSQEVRMYTLGATLGLASVFFLVRCIAGRSHAARDFIAYVVISALGLYTLYYFAFLLVFENGVAAAWLLTGASSSRIGIRERKPAIRLWLGSQLVIAGLYALWIPIAFRQAMDPPVPPWRTFAPLVDVLVESFSALALGQSVSAAAVWPVLMMIAAIVGLALAARPYLSESGGQPVSPFFLLAYTGIPLALIYIFSLWKPLYHVRYVYIYSPGFYLLLALGLDQVIGWRLGSRLWRLASAALILVLVFTFSYSAYNYWFNPRYAEDDLRGAVRSIAAQWRPGDAVLLDAGYTYTAFDYYYNQPVAWRGRLVDYVPRDARTGAVVVQVGSIGGSPDLGWGSRDSDFYATTADETRAALDRLFEAHPRVWLLRLYDTVVDPQGVVRAYLAERGRLIQEEGFVGESFARVQGYLTPSGLVAKLPSTATARPVLLGNRVSLAGFEPNTVTVRAGAPLDVNLYWQAVEPTNVDSHLFVGLFSEAGKLVASNDEVPLGNGLGTSRWSAGELWREPVRLLIPAHLPPGDYVLRVTLYNPLTNEPLAPAPNDWVSEQDQIELTRALVQN